MLLIACANVASLLLARGSTRQRELAIRSALGGSRGRLIRQLLTEHLVLAAGGGVLGALVAVWGIDLVRLLPAPPPNLFVPYTIGAEHIRVDRATLAFTATLSILTGLAFGLLPALTATRANAVEPMKHGAPQATAGRRQGRLRGGLVVAEVALALVLLIGAGLLLRTFVRITSIDPGFDPSGVLTFDLVQRAWRDAGAPLVRD